MAQHLILIRTILTTINSTGRVEYRIKGEFRDFYISKIILATDMPIVLRYIYPIYRGVDKLNHL